MKENLTMENKNSLASSIRLGTLMRVCIGIFVFCICLAASTNLFAKVAKVSLDEEGIAKKFRGKVLRIQVQHSGLYLDVIGQSLADRGRVGQWTSDPGNQQRWLIEPVPDGGGKVYIINMHSGKFLDVIGGNKASRAEIGQWAYQIPESGVNLEGRQQMWWLEQLEAGYWRIKNDNSNKYLDVLGQNKDVGGTVTQWDSNPGDQQIWKIEFDKKLDLPSLKTESFSENPPALTGMGMPSKGASVEIERLLVPFFLVTDRTMSPSEQVSRSPYYVMSTSKQWVPVKVQSNPNSTLMDITVTESNTMETSKKAEVEKSVSATVTAKMSYGIGEASASISASFTEKSTTGQIVGNLRGNQTIYHVDPRSSLVFWNDVNTFRLFRGTGDLVNSWEKPGKFIIKNRFPQTDTGQ